MHFKIDKICIWSWIYLLEEICVSIFQDIGDSLKNKQVMILIHTFFIFIIKLEFFSACIVIGLEYLHQNGILHKDIKPENLVFDLKGIYADRLY